jgi:tetratricopeptide (TPR) repeat protein
LVRQASAFLIAPDRAVTSAQALAGGFGVRLRQGESTIGAKLVGLDLLHDIAILKLNQGFPVAKGLVLQGTELLGTERVAILGTTVLMEKVAGLETLVGVVRLDPLGTFAAAKQLGQQGLQGAPILNGQGRVLGMITSYLDEKTDTRFIVSSAAILAVPAIDPVDVGPGLVPGDPGQLVEVPAEDFDLARQGVLNLLAGQKELAVDQLAGKPSEIHQKWHMIALISNDRNVEAIEIADAYVAGHAQDAMGFLLRGLAHERLMEDKLAAADYRTARQLDEKGVYSTMALARAYVKAQRGQESLQYLKGLLAQYPGYVPAILLRGEMYNDRLRMGDAQHCFEEILAVDPDHPGAWAGLGRVQLHQKSPKRALMSFERALQKDPTHLAAQVGRAEVFVMEREWEAALAALQPLLEAHPTHSEIIRLAARTYARQQNLERARDLYEQATFINPDDKEAFLGLGTTYKEMMQLDRAIAAYDNVLRIDPKNVAALFSAGFCHLLLGDRGEARARYKTLRFIDPESAEQLFKMIYNK